MPEVLGEAEPRKQCVPRPSLGTRGNLTLRVAPDLDAPGVSFANAVTDPDAVHYVPFVEEGVREFVDRQAVEGRAVGHLRVTLTAITIHPVDAKGWRFKQAAGMALAAAFESAGVEL